jgi:hypothetical protein
MIPKQVLVLLALVPIAALASSKNELVNPVSTTILLQAAPSEVPVRLENGSILYAELSKTVDAKKAKVGDPVSAILTADVLAHGKIVVRHDSKLVGHVTEAQVHSKDTPESRLGIVFDKVMTKEGEIPFQSLLLAIRPSERPIVEIPSGPASMRPSMQGPMPSPQGSNTSQRITPSLGNPMNPHNREIARTGPTEIDGLSLDSPANGGPQVIVSKQHTVKLESGIKIELRVTGQ